MYLIGKHNYLLLVFVVFILSANSCLLLRKEKDEVSIMIHSISMQ